MDLDVTDMKMAVLLNYLRQLKPLLVHGTEICLRSKDRLLSRVANRPDFLLPFRQKAPMIIKAMQTIYSTPDRLRTPEGFWNLLIYRGVFYGSTYATEDLRWFNSFEDWEAYFNDSTKTKDGEKEKYYANICAYGFNNIKRKTENISMYWAECDRWTSFLETKPGAKEMYKFLLQSKSRKEGSTKVFTNIGPLAALLICGDLIETGVLKMPDVDVWAELIYHVKKGGITGLQRLALLNDTYTEEEAVQAFSKLHNFIGQNLTEEEHLIMGYDIIMLEHALCKFSRVTRKAGGSTSAGKKRKKATK